MHALKSQILQALPQGTLSPASSSLNFGCSVALHSYSSTACDAKLKNPGKELLGCFLFHHPRVAAKANPDEFKIVEFRLVRPTFP